MEFRVLGPLQVVDRTGPVTLGGPMQRAVLGALLLEPNRVVSMDRLIDRLWGDNPPSRASGTLQAYVSNLRRALGGPESLVWRAPGYQLRIEPDDVDASRFERLLDEARSAPDPATAEALLAEARSLWRGPLLADLTAVDFPERVRFDELRLVALEEHGSILVALGREQELAAEIDAAAAEHPLRERLRAVQMIGRYRAGLPVEALRVYADLRRELVDEHGLDPGPELRRLQEQILRQDPALDAPVASSLVGRGPELAALRRLLHAHGGRLALIEGEAGIGKTRLAEAIAAEAAALGHEVRWGRAIEGGGAPPWWLWTQVAPGLSRPAVDDPVLARQRLNQALVDELAVARPVLILEDLQWADTAALSSLEFVAAQLPVFIVATYRESDLGDAPALRAALGVLARLPGVERLALRGLSPDEVAGLIRAHGIDLPAGPVHERTEGNPFFITELLRLDAPMSAVPLSVRDVVRRRVARLPATTRALLDTAAVAGREFDLNLVGDLAVVEALASVEPAVEAGILEPIPDAVGRFRFSHALVSDTLASDLTLVHRARVHERLGRALADAYGEDARQALAIAEHLWAALPTGDVAVALAAQLRAADVAWTGLAYEQTEALLARSAALLATRPPDPALDELDLGLHIRLGSTLSARHGYTLDARSAFNRARTLADRLDRRADVLPALWGLGATAVVRAELDDAEAVTQAALDEGRLVGGPALAIGYQGVGIVDFYRGRLVDARKQFAAALSVWADVGDRVPVLHGPPAAARPDVMVPSYDALAASVLGERADADRRIAQALHAAAATGVPYAIAFVHSFHSRLGVLQRSSSIARLAAQEAIAVAEEHGFALLVPHAVIPLGWAQAVDGDPRGGLATIERGLADLERMRQRILVPFHLALQASVLRMLGHDDAASSTLARARAENAARGGGFETAFLADS
jgi:DNA-binding SARP family transcriptional activator